MNLVQQYKDILNTLYGATSLPRLKDEPLRTELANLWFRLNDQEQNHVQEYSERIRK